MHQLALALKRKGYEVSGSDDAIYDPAKSNLEKEGLLPDIGWDATRISSDLDKVILGMHARENNPELIRAKELNIPILSFPEFIAEECKDKKRIVIAGSHGKTTTTSMLMHGLKQMGMSFDYLVGSSIEGFEFSVELSNADLVIIEGDEYLSSPIDRRSKFLWYDPHVSIITGIAYDHINVFPTFESYLSTFDQFIALHRVESSIIWFEGDKHLSPMIAAAKCNSIPYNTPDFLNKDGQCSIVYKGQEYPQRVIGEHNLQNLMAASLVAESLGVSQDQFFTAVKDFEGAGKRMEKIFEQEGQVVYRDFAHSPSKLEATVNAVASTYSSRPLFAAFELHTFSSLNRSFLPYYADCLKLANTAIVYIDPHVFEHRKMEKLSKSEIQEAFGDVEVLDDPSLLKSKVEAAFSDGNNLLLMSSGTFSGMELDFE